MRIVFVQKDSMVKIAIMLLSARLKEAGHSCEVVMEAAEDDVVAAALALDPGAVAFSCTTGSEGWALSTAAAIKSRAPGLPVIFGGPHPTFFPAVLERPEVDVICRGEGEDVVVDVADALERGLDALAGVPNVSVKLAGEVIASDVRPLILDLDALPSPDWSVYASRYTFLVPYYLGNFPVITSRGCPHRCSYCFNASYQDMYRGKGRYMRWETPERAVDKLVEAKELHGIRRVNFVDDSFAGNSRWLARFAEGYVERVGLPLICNVRADTVTSETAPLLREMGCYCARMGVESGDERLRRTVLDKTITDEQIRSAAARLREARIKLTTFNMYGIPGETLADAMRTLALNRELKVDYAQCSVLQPYPGTKIREYAEAYMSSEGAGRDAAADDVGESYFVASPLRMEHKTEIINLQKLTATLVRLRAPLWLVRRLIRLPDNRVFHAIFQAEYAYFRFKLDLKEAGPFLRFALKSRSYMARRRRPAPVAESGAP